MYIGKGNLKKKTLNAGSCWLLYIIQCMMYWSHKKSFNLVSSHVYCIFVFRVLFTSWSWVENTVELVWVYCWARKKSFDYPSSHGTANLGVRKKERCFCLQIHTSPFLLWSRLLILLIIITRWFLMEDVLSISFLTRNHFKDPKHFKQRFYFYLSQALIYLLFV